MISIEGPFSVELGSEESSATPTEVESTFVALPLLHADVHEINALRTVELQVQLGGHGSMTVGPNDDFESWSVALPDGHLFVGLPGGDVGVFPPAPEAI